MIASRSRVIRWRRRRVRAEIAPVEEDAGHDSQRRIANLVGQGGRLLDQPETLLNSLGQDLHALRRW